MDSTEIEKLVGSLKKLEAGFLPYPIFKEIARLVTLVAVEVVVFVRQPESGAPKVLLLKRPADDEFWPNEWHVPGCIVRSTDKKDSFEDSFKRIEDEYGFNFTEEPKHLNTQFTETKRGTIVAVQYYLVLDVQVPSENLFDVEMLPTPIVEEHKDFIVQAVKKVNAESAS